MKREIQVFEYANDILQAVKIGALLTTKVGDKVNSMTISWGTLGIEWGRSIFIAFVREGRYTREQLDKNPEFTINISLGAFEKKILALCGKKSGRDCNKIEELSLTLEDGDCISVPAIKELPLTLECRVIYKQLQCQQAIPAYIKDENYPQDVDSSYPLANKDYHIAYYGEIIKAYIIE